MSSLVDEWISKLKEQVNLQLDAKEREIEALRSRLQGYYNEAAKAYEERDAALRRLGEAVNLLRYMTESFDANLTRKAAEFVAANTPRVGIESVRGILKEPAVEKLAPNSCDGKHTGQHMTYVGNGAWKCDACGGTV